jgi:uncharacterized protein YbaP (TraB family)
MKRFISFLAVILFSVGLFSCASSPASDPVLSGSSVWKISKNGKSLFLGGSVHILRAGDFPLPGEFDRAFLQSTLLVLEADLEQMGDEGVVQYLMYRMILPSGQTLQSVLDSDTYDLLEAACAAYEYPIEVVSNFKPSMVITILTVLQIQKLGFVQEGIDAYYLNKAQATNKPVAFLETVEAQIDLIVSMGEGYENDFVRYSLSDMSNTENELTMLLAEWKTGNASTTEKSLIKWKEEWPVMYQSLITDRNAAWVPQIEEYLASGQVPFIIVGAAHLHGPDGLLTQLKNSGCTVEQL